MPYSDMFKRKMVQRLSGPDAISASALSKQVDVPQSTLSKWLRNAGIKPLSVNGREKVSHFRSSKVSHFCPFPFDLSCAPYCRFSL